MFIFTAQLLIMNNTDFKIVDIPIEFKEINPSDFDSNFYDVSEKEIVTPNNEGYISDELQDKLTPDLYNKNTIVINAGVGQGKSYSVIRLIETYFKDYINNFKEKYLIFLTVPFKSLIQQYYDELKDKELPEIEIFNTTVFDREIYDYGDYETKQKIYDSVIGEYGGCISIMTTNLLLGNSGEDNIFQKRVKKEYFKRVLKHCKEKDKKIIVFYDEIHDSIANFSQENIVKLWRFQDIIQKNYLVSATFNEASKEIIKYLSEFTDKKIRIIESKRVIIPEKQSKLHLIFENNVLNKSERFLKLVESKIETNENIDLIIYSKKQITEIFGEQSELINNVDLISNKLNLCYNDTFDEKVSNNKYDSEKINVGTNFTTGVNIKKENCSFFVVLPVRSNKKYLKNKGVFTSGVNSIIQTLARLRVEGNIYIIMPQPFSLNKESLPYSEEINNAILYNFNKYSKLNNKINYSNINDQSKVLISNYNKLIKINKEGIDNLKLAEDNNLRRGMNELIFPKLEKFILKKGEKLLSKNFFNGDLSTYVFWAAITNQFLNCKLESIIVEENTHYNSGELNELIVNSFKQIVYSNPFNDEEAYFLDYFSHYFLFKKLEEEIILNKTIFIDNVPATKKQIADINFKFIWLSTFGDSTPLDEIDKNIAVYRKLFRSHYFQSSIYNYSKLHVINDSSILVKGLNDVDINLEIGENYITLINLYKKWVPFIENIRNEVFTTMFKTKNTSKEVNCISTKPTSEFKSLFDLHDMDLVLNELIQQDYFIYNNIIPFRENYKKTKSNAETFYSTLLEVCFDFSSTNKKRVKGEYNYIIDEIINFEENSEKWVNIHYPYFPFMIIE